MGSLSKLVVSPSQFEKFRRCLRAYSFEYVMGLRPPSSPKQQFGTAVHAQLEQWLSKGTPPADTPEGRVAKQGINKGLLPTPSDKLRVEDKWSFWAGLYGDTEVFFSGFADCIVPPSVGCCGAGEAMVIDHKTTSDLRWAKTEDQLKTDPQALLYSAWAMLQFQVGKIKARWVYYAADAKGERKPRGAQAVCVEFQANGAAFLDGIDRILQDTKELVRIRTNEVQALDLAPSPESCQAYGGCPHRNLCALSSADRLAGYFERDRRGKK